jgi:hypothetical protein
MNFRQDIYDQIQLWQMHHYHPYDQSWNAHHELHYKWINSFINIFQKIKCCAICRLVEPNHQQKHFSLIENAYNKLNIHEFGCATYGIVNCLLSTYTAPSNGIVFLCLKRCVEFDAPMHGKYVFLNHKCKWKHFYHNIHYTYNYYFLNSGLPNCKMIDTSLFNNPLLSWDSILDFKNLEISF